MTTLTISKPQFRRSPTEQWYQASIAGYRARSFAPQAGYRIATEHRDAFLEANNIVSGKQKWFTAKLANGQTQGVLACSAPEAGFMISFISGELILDLFPDPNGNAFRFFKN